MRPSHSTSSPTDDVDKLVGPDLLISLEKEFRRSPHNTKASEIRSLPSILLSWEQWFFWLCHSYSCTLTWPEIFFQLIIAYSCQLSQFRSGELPPCISVFDRDMSSQRSCYGRKVRSYCLLGSTQKFLKENTVLPTVGYHHSSIIRTTLTLNDLESPWGLFLLLSDHIPVAKRPILRAQW